MSDTLSIHAEKIVNKDIVPLRRMRSIAEKVCNMMYGTEKRTKVTIYTTVAALFLAAFLQHFASTGVCQAVGLK